MEPWEGFSHSVHPRKAGGHRWNPSTLLHVVYLLAGGLAGASLLTVLSVPAGTLIGAVLGAMTVNRFSDERFRRHQPRHLDFDRIRGLPGPVRVVGQVLLGVMAGTRLSLQTLEHLAQSALPVTLSVLVLLALTVVLARYLFSRRGIEPVTAVLAAAPGGISELTAIAQQEGADMHVVLTIHLFRVLVVVLVVLPTLIFLLGL